MVDISGKDPRKSGFLENSISNNALIIAGVVIFSVFGYIAYKLYQSIQSKSKRKTDKKMKIHKNKGASSHNKKS
ncbi:unnamed protein product [Gordionus sp. m RMFG-2023]